MKKIKLVSFIVLNLIILSGCNNNSNKNNETQNSTKIENSASTETNSSTQNKKETGDFVSKASEASFDGKILKGNTYTIKLTDHKVIQPGEKGNEYGDKPIIAFWYDTLVSPDYSDSQAINATNAWIMNFKAIQDNDPNKVNELQVTTLPDDQFLDSQTADIKPGGTVQNAIAYTLTDTETPVTLTAQTIMGDKLGEGTFELK